MHVLREIPDGQSEEVGLIQIVWRETAGLPKSLLEQFPGNGLRIPMFNAQSRSLNLSNCVALVLYEALRQQKFPGEIE